MKLNLHGPGDQYYIRAYRPGAITVNDQLFSRSLIIGGGELHADWAPQHIGELQAEHLTPILEMAPEVVLIGTGERLVFPDPELTSPLYGRGIGVEIMDTGAACRTYNVLISEGRAVVAALIIETVPPRDH